MMMPWFLGNSYSFSYQWGWFLGPLMFWSVIWKGLALWHAAKRDEKWWFIGLLIINTAGILEIIYLVFVAHALSANKAQRKHRRA